MRLKTKRGRVESLLNCCSILSAREDGGVAQLGEHLPCKQGVRGSNPLISTTRVGANRYGLIAQLVRARA